MNCITTLPNYTYDYQRNSNPTKSFVKKIALESLQELATTLAMTSVTSCFLPSPMAIAIHYTIGVSICALNTTIRVVRVFYYYQLESVKDPNNQALKFLKIIYNATEWLCPMQWGFFYSCSAGTLVHEVGHALPASLLLHNANARIEINNLGGGTTTYEIHRYSPLGRLFGSKATNAVITAGGFSATVLISTAMIIKAHHVRKSNPQLYRYLIAMSTISVAKEVLYAMTAFGKTIGPSNHDFVNLWSLGVHPLASVTAIIALPIIGTLLGGQLGGQAWHCGICNLNN